MANNHTTTRLLLFLCLGLLQLSSTNAFATTASASRATSTSSTELSAAKRREVFKGVRRVLFAGALFQSAFQREAALAEQAPPQGRIVEFELAGLIGEQSTGKVQIQLREDWAPRGVARFEVRLKDG